VQGFAFAHFHEKNGRIAQVVEQLTLNQRVVGSSPTAPTILFPAVKNLMHRFVLLLLTFILTTTCSFAEGYIETQPGLLDDDSFYGVVVCGVLPGETCSEQPAKWSKNSARNLTVQLHSLTADSKRYALTSRALDAAIANINTATPALHIVRKPDRHKRRVGIDIFVTRLKAGQVIRGTGTELDGDAIEGAKVLISWNNAKKIHKATIVLAGDLLESEVRSIVLEELVQALGPINDIKNPAYEGVSIFSEDSNAQTVLGRQDKMVLKRLYAE
jgi:Protein of unknown function (DUF2927)